MEAKELRIGNLIHVYRKPEDDYVSVYSIKSIFYNDDENKYYVELDDGFYVNIDKGIIPIKLTDYWLTKCGFKKHGDFYILENNTFFQLRIYISLKHNKSRIGVNEEYEIKHLEYLHQLQNLFFALTGELLKTNIDYIVSENIIFEKEKKLAEEIFNQFSVSKKDQDEIFEYIENGYVLHSVENSQNKFEEGKTKIVYRKELLPNKNENPDYSESTFSEFILLANHI